MTAFDRREFCKLLGGGIVVLITTPATDLFGQRTPPSYPEDPNAYLRIGENGRVTLYSGKVEMGQGINTSLSQMAAEELGVGLDAIDIVMGDTDLVPFDMGTWGSLTTRFFGPAVRAAAAEARTVLLKLAAEKLGVPREQLRVDNGVVTGGGKKVTYAELAAGKSIARLVDEKAILKSAKDFKIIGKPAKRVDAREKVTGRAIYAGDIRRPGMLHGRVLHPPMHGAKRKSVDTSKAKAIPGVTVIEKDDLVAVLHADPEIAAKALAAIAVEWERPAAAFDHDSIYDYFTGKVPGAEVTGQFQSRFETAYVAHAPMETHSAVAEMKDGKLTAWIGTQSPFGARTRIAQTLGLEEKNVRVITPFIGGGFGGKSPVGQAIEAARLAQISGKPVMVVWTRAEEFFFDTFGPAAVVRVTSSMDESGKITQWQHDVWAAGTRAAAVPYDVPDAKVTPYMGRGMAGADLHPFGTGPWRAPGAGTNVFARESHIDIMAAAAKIDPLEFRLKNAKDDRVRNVLKAVAAASGWKPGAGSTGQGRGLAIAEDAGTWCALVAEVDVDRAAGTIRVKRVVAAQDMGLVINPEGAKMQMEGCIAMGLGYVLMEELRFRGGEILDENFGTYSLPRFSHVPRIECVLVKNDDLAPQGGGEPAIVPMGAAIANAVFDATGARLYRLPMTAERVKAALKG
ncbi:MAG TPA: molybdopterin cofactor-binding domain-containing protein [Thermoanaerobaculia bacterium]|nr:molybdopterin cofactor-binding domain-containing protein [Thermoanaerobaculia bacterium]